jgi:hypothetical protein
VSFFEPPEPTPEPPPPFPLPELPGWLGPPDNVLGGLVALGLVAARSKDAAVWLESATAYPTGVQFRLGLRWRAEVQGLGMRGAAWHAELRAGEELPAELFRAGFELSDGSKATWLGAGGGAVAMSMRPDERPKGPVLRSGGGGGGGRRWSEDLWLWPLPPEGRLEFVCEWPALGIELTRAELDARQIREAATRSQTLWENGQGSSAPSPTPWMPS